MRWTSEVPLREGWYWRRTKETPPSKCEPFLFLPADEYCQDIAPLFEWAGPIPPPTEPQEARADG